MRHRRILLAVPVAVLAFALVAGMAASLGGVTSTGLGADDTVVASCDTDGVTTDFTTAYTTTPAAGFEVGDVTVAGIADACDGDTMTVTLTGAGNAALGEVTQAVPVGAAFTNMLDFSGEDVLAEAVTGVHVVISG